MILIAAILGVLVLVSCQDKIEETYTVNSPVYMSYNDLRSSFKVAEAEDIIQPGKIYFKDNFIFVNEYQKGIHVINNALPSNPAVIKFIEIPGNIDIAIKGDKLYADSYVDLLTIDISNIQDIKVIDRDTSVFPYFLPQIEVDGPVDFVDQDQGVVIGYKEMEKTEVIENTTYYNYYPAYMDFASESKIRATTNTASYSGSVSSQGIGVGGSMARFALYDDVLYLIHESDVLVYSVENNSNPTYVREFYATWGLETLFPYEDKLFMGSTSGMLVFSLENPLSPSQISEFSHMTACDPVVVDGDYAYVTLRGGNMCGAVSSQLDVIDISNIQSPRLLKTYSLDEPYGLGIDDKTLFICDGNSGLKIYDATNPLKVSENMIASYPEINAFDVIPLGAVLVMIGEDGLYQYDYSDLSNIHELSHIPIYSQTE